MEPSPPPRPDLYTSLNLVLLAVLAVLLLLPLLGVISRPPVTLVVLLLAAKLALGVVRSRTDPSYRRPTAWILDGALIALLLSQAARPG